LPVHINYSVINSSAHIQETIARDYVYIYIYMCARRLEALAYCVRVCVCVPLAWGRPLAAAQWAPLFFPFGFNHCRIKVQCLTEKRSILPSLGAAVQTLSSRLSPSSGFLIKIAILKYRYYYCHVYLVDDIIIYKNTAAFWEYLL